MKESDSGAPGSSSGILDYAVAIASIFSQLTVSATVPDFIYKRQQQRGRDSL